MSAATFWAAVIAPLALLQATILGEFTIGQTPGVSARMESPSNGSWTSNAVSGELFTGLRYHMYDPDSLLAFSLCRPRNYGNRKHSVDKLFIQQLRRERKSVPPDQADVFIVPALLSQVAEGQCGAIARVMRQLHQFLNHSPWFQRHGGADHIIVAGHFLVNTRMAESALSRGVVGHFEARSNSPDLFFSTGYSTDAALEASGWLPKHVRVHPKARHPEPPATVAWTGPQVVPFYERKYDVSFVGQVGARPAYKHRRQLGCSWVTKGKAEHSTRMFVHLKGSFGRCKPGGQEESIEGLPHDKAQRVLGDSRFFLALTGDAPTTDRLNNCFDTLTIPIVLSSQVNSIVDALAFSDVVPWRNIFVVLNQAAWDEDPVQAVLNTVDALSKEEIAARVQLMREHADDLSFASPSTRMHTRLINAAWQAMQKRRARYDVTTNTTRSQQ